MNDSPGWRLGYGVTVWSSGSKTGHLDGIGVYTQALHAALTRIMPRQRILPYAFGDNLSEMPCGQPKSLVPKTARYLVKAACFNQRLPCDVEVFHATDHHIPLLRDVPVVATVMDLIPFLHPEWVSSGLRRFKNWVFKRNILSADHWITISEHSRSDLITHFGIPAHKITVTPLGVESRYFAPVSRQEKQAVLSRYELAANFFLFIGTLQPRKNIHGLLYAHAKLPLKARQRYPLVIVGRNGWGVDDLLPILAQREQEGTLRWLDYVPPTDVYALLASARALVFLSLYEGFGLPILEAFASGCPVIASNTTSIPEVTDDCALLVDPQDVDAIADAMQQMIDDDALIARLKPLGVSRAQHFTWDACALATQRAYQAVL